MPESIPVPFNNKGVSQKKDPSQLGPGEYYQLENAWSSQEGALTIRTGHQKLSQTSFASACVSLSKLNLGASDSSNPRYIGSGTNIYRDLPPYTGNTSVYNGLASGQRWSAYQYNAGTAGTPSLYIASHGQAGSLGTGALRDNGSYSTLQKWGIDPPLVPVQATAALPSIVYITVPGGSPVRFVAGVNSNGSGLKTVSQISMGNPGYTRITPTAGGTINGVNGIYVGMILSLNDSTAGNETVIVLATDSVSFYTITQIAHVAANVTLGWFQETFTTVASTIDIYTFTGLTANAAFNGTSDNGYSTDDNFHIALRCTDIVNVTSIEIRIVPNYSGSAGSATDYYSYTVFPATSMSAGSSTSPAWLELNIPKNTFKNVGNAGSGSYTWLNINEIDIVATANASGGGQTVGVSSLYFIGGGGLNSSAAGTTLYDYLYCFRNPTSQAVGNPCPAMIPANIPPAVTNGKMTLTLTGTAQAATIANGIGEISGNGSLKIYRRGGTFSDGFYRHIGYAANPGSGGTVIFVDNASDQSLDTADTLEFDNDPPVPSSLPVPLTASIIAFQPSGGGSDSNTSAQANGGAATDVTTNATTRLVLSALPTNFIASAIASVITVGSTIQVGFGNTFEQCLISSVGYNTTGHATSAWVEMYLQFNHNITSVDTSETVECDTILRGTCDLIHQDFDCIFLAGDANNPATLYQAKTGRPESFPVVNLENNFAQQINVGSPSNPILGVTSLGPGEIVCLNQNNLFIINVWAGQMQQPIQAPASRGLYAKWCWCKGDNRLWYLAYDGIYEWAGGESKKVSEPIDYLFKKQTVNGILPIDFTKALKFSFSYAENSLFCGVIDTSGVYHRLRYETLYNRWTVETIYAASTGSATCTIDSLFTEPDTGNLLVGITDTTPASWLWFADFYSTTDGWVTLPTDGTPIQFTIWKYWPIANPSADYQVGEIMLEMVNAADNVTLALLYNYSTTATDTITIAGGAVSPRGRFFASVGSTESGTVQYAIGLKLTGYTGASGLTEFFTFQWRDYPWSDAGYPGPKTFGWLTVQANTTGASVPFVLQVDGAVAYSFYVTGTFWNRATTVTLPSNITGTQYRVIPATGYSGTLQLYGVQPKFEKLPMPLTHWDSLMQSFGFDGFKFIWQVWVDYQSAVPLTFSIYRDGNVLFFTATLPALSTRGVSRFYLPPVYTPVSYPQFNKSKLYRFTLDSQDGTTPFQMYRDASRVEVRNLDGDQRSGFEQKVIWTEIPLAA